jgi:hypothetical protein
VQDSVSQSGKLLRPSTPSSYTHLKPLGFWCDCEIRFVFMVFRQGTAVFVRVVKIGSSIHLLEHTISAVRLMLPWISLTLILQTCWTSNMLGTFGVPDTWSVVLVTLLVPIPAPKNGSASTIS